MPLSTYDELQTSILSWLARPGDPLVSPAVPDMIQLFEREATRRLKVGGAEKRASLTALSAAVALPADFGELRLATSGGVVLSYVTPMQLPDGGGPPAHYTIIGNELRLGPSPSGGCTIEIVYQSGVPPLSDTNTTNWLLTAHPDCYLFGSLVEAESFIGSDERVPLWAQRREAAFASIETADRKARWGGAPLSIRAEGVSGGNGTAAGDWTSAPPVPIPIAGIVAGDGLTGGGTEGIVTVALSTPVTVGRGGTGATTAPAALANLGGAPLANPVLTGDPRAPTPAPGDSDTSIATTGFVQAALVAQALAGDVTGPTSTTAVVRLQGRPVAATAPTSLQVLQWSGTNWVPATIAAGGTLTGVTAGTGITVSGAAPSPTVALTVPVTVANGGTGATTAGAALTALGAAPLNAPVFTGDPQAPTPATADNDTSIATTAFVKVQGYATSASVTAGDNLRVLKVGDTMTGTLSIAPLTSVPAQLVLNKSFVVAGNNIIGQVGGLSRWSIEPGNTTAETGAGNVGSDFSINRFTDAGAYLSTPLTISRASGNVGISTLEVNGTGRITAQVAPTSGAGLEFSYNAGTGFILAYDRTGAAYQPVNLHGSTLTCSGDTSITLISSAATQMTVSAGVAVGAPTGGALGAGKLNAVEVRANNVVLTSDVELKTDIEPLAGALPLVAAIEPRRFRWKPLPEPDPFEGPDGEMITLPGMPPDFTEKLNRGFLAQEVVETLGGEIKDGVDLGGMVAVLWQAVRELSAKVEALTPTPPRSRQ